MKIVQQIFREYKQMMCGYVCIGFTDFTLKGKS